MCMNPNVYPLSETQKRSPQVTLNHEPNSSFVFTTKKNVTNQEDKIQYNLGQNMLKHMSHKNIYVFLSSCQKWKPSQNECLISPLPLIVPCCMFRITRESHNDFQTKTTLNRGVGRVSYFFCLEEMEVWHKSQKTVGI